MFSLVLVLSDDPNLDDVNAFLVNEDNTDENTECDVDKRLIDVELSFVLLLSYSMCCYSLLMLSKLSKLLLIMLSKFCRPFSLL